MKIANRKLRMLCMILFLVVTSVLCMTTWPGLSIAQGIGKKEYPLSAGTSVPTGELEAVGTIPGCTATLIGNSLVLTAAHCVCPNDVNAQNCKTRATFTLHNVFPIDNPATPTDESKSRTDVTISGNVRVHPEYTQRGWLREDYAVIELDQPITDVAKVTPLPVEAPHNIPFEGNTLTLVGYGATAADCTGPGLGKMKMDVPVAVSGWGGIAFKNAKLHSCPGDSGGPVLNSNKHVVGVCSWGDDNTGDSTYRPTSYAYNWIYGIPQPKWSSCSWVLIGKGGKNSHQPTQLCPDGGFLTALDLDGDRNKSAHDTPVIGQALCCKVAGAANLKWGFSLWKGIEKAGIHSHSMSGTWCPQGHFITGIDQDACGNCDAKDSPVIGQVQCSKLAGSQYSNWGSSYWMDVGAKKSHQAGSGWCLDGAFIAQIDLDREDAADPHDSPVIGRVKCSAMMPATLPTPTVKEAMESNIDRPGMNYKNFNLSSPDPKPCQNSCIQDKACKAWTYVKPGAQGQDARCWLKSGVPSAVKNTCCISGVIGGQIPPDIKQVTPIRLPAAQGPTFKLDKDTGQIKFGDGTEGKTLPEGDKSIKASSYRAGENTKSAAQDLAVRIVQCPQSAKAGQDLTNLKDPKAGFQVVALLTGGPAVKDVAVDIVLKKNTSCPVPAAYAVYSPNYSDGVLLKGGREHVSLNLGQTLNVKLNGANTIPADTPTGSYYLCAVIDAGNKVREANERNNCACCPVRITAGAADMKAPGFGDRRKGTAK